MSSDQTQDQRLARCGDGRQGNRGYATASNGPDCFCCRNETAKHHGNKVNNCNSRIVSCGKNVFVKENNPEGRLGNKMKKDYI